jgi:hypothetical protein
LIPDTCRADFVDARGETRTFVLGTVLENQGCSVLLT